MHIRSTDTTNVSDGLLTAHTRTLEGYREILRAARADTSYTTPESALASPNDSEARSVAEAVAQEFGGALKTVLLVGIGGSDLGTRALYDALHGHADSSTRTHTPRLVAYATLEPRVLAKVEALFAQHTTPEEIVLVVISKSGTTSETLGNAQVLYRKLSERFGAAEAARRTIIISDDDVPLVARAREYGIRHIPMPKHIGGRFSVFTVVGLVPLALLGIDIKAFCEGAEAAITAAVPQNGPGPASVLAALLFEEYLSGITIHELFLFHPELETLGKWYRQLLGESIGKEREDGTRVGITPTVAIGSTDLHSLGQLVLGGPKSRFTSFVSAPNMWTNTEPCSEEGPFTAEMLAGKKVGEVMQAIFGGIQTTYKNQGLPFISIELNHIDAREIGAFMALHMATIMYLGKLFDVPTFTQPAVESYKSEARRLLTN